VVLTVEEASDAATAHDDSLGCVLEIEEFGVHDGPGIRTVVFLKGCPLHCSWCHNPESINFGPEMLPDQVRCASCGERCIATRSCPSCGQPVPMHESAVGELLSAGALAMRVERHAATLMASGGGVTFSGGEPMAQARFLIAAASELPLLHIAVETSGHVSPAVFRRVSSDVDLVMIDVKHTDPEVHRTYTGHTNMLILGNLKQLCEGSTPFIVRIPLIPGVNDGRNNLRRTAELIAGASALRGVELLPYNTMAPAKYARARRDFKPGFDTTQSPRIEPSIFEHFQIPCEVL
jgi:pyruvate formate lyase activating enzyme